MPFIGEGFALGPAVLAVIVATLTAVGVRNLLIQFHRRLIDDQLRLKSAMAGLDLQKAELQYLLESRHVQKSVKKFLVEISALIVDRNFARRVADWVEAGCPDQAGASSTSLFRMLVRLRVTEPRLFETIGRAIRGAIVTMRFQWPETHKCRLIVSHRMVTDDAAQAFALAVGVWMIARRQEEPAPVVTRARPVQHRASVKPFLSIYSRQDFTLEENQERADKKQVSPRFHLRVHS